jgi:hypothetical protein
MKYFIQCLSLVFLGISPAASAGTSDDIGYPSVNAAFEALRADQGTKSSEDEGWTIFIQRNAGWTFAPPWHPAYPAAFKRTASVSDAKLSIQAGVKCQGDKKACSQLINEFERDNDRVREMRDRRSAGERAGVSHDENIGGWIPRSHGPESLSVPTRPSFDCARAAIQTEKVICASRVLSLLDGEMAAWYATLTRGGHPSVAIGQRNWLRTRNQCGAASAPETCLLETYRRRVRELLREHIDTYLPFGRYCLNRCQRRPERIEVEDLRTDNDRVEFLVLSKSRYQDAVGTDYSLAMYRDGRLELGRNICSKRLQNDIEFGAVDCVPRKVQSVFRSNASSDLRSSFKWKESIDERDWKKLASADLPAPLLAEAADKMPAGATITMNVPFSAPLTDEQRQRQAPPYEFRMFPTDCESGKTAASAAGERCVERFVYAVGMPEFSAAETGVGNSAWDQEGCFFELYFERGSAPETKVLSLRPRQAGQCYPTPSSGQKRSAPFDLYDKERKVGEMSCARVSHDDEDGDGETVDQCPTVTVGFIAVTLGQSDIRLKLPSK